MLAYEAIKSDGFDPDAMIDILDHGLGLYQIDTSQLSFLIDDNAALNVSLTKTARIPLVGRASDRPHLATGFLV